VQSDYLSPGPSDQVDREIIGEGPERRPIARLGLACNDMKAVEQDMDHACFEVRPKQDRINGAGEMRKQQ
jgi:hypothetical protein